MATAVTWDPQAAAQRRADRQRWGSARATYLADIAKRGAEYRRRAQDALRPYVQGVLAAADGVLSELDDEERGAVEHLRRELAAGDVSHLTLERLCALLPTLFAIPEHA